MCRVRDTPEVCPKYSNNSGQCVLFQISTGVEVRFIEIHDETFESFRVVGIPGILQRTHPIEHR